MNGHGCVHARVQCVHTHSNSFVSIEHAMYITYTNIYVCIIYIYNVTIINIKEGHEFERNQRKSYGKLGGRKGKEEIM